jgi:hypothetical protein
VPALHADYKYKKEFTQCIIGQVVWQQHDIKMNYQVIILTDTNPDSAERQRIKPLGAYLIADVLRKNGFTVLVIDYFSQIGFHNLQYFLKSFISAETLFVGYSGSLFFLTRDSDLKENIFKNYNFKEINSTIKQINPKTKIVVGGACSKSICNYNLTENDNLGFDYAIHGYSEGMVVNFANNLKNNQTPAFNNVHNKLYEISYDSKGESFDFHHSHHSWHHTDFIRDNETLPMEIARGCIFKCKFCSYPLLGKNPNDNSYYKQENNILNEVIHNYENFKTLNYFIIDDTFNERSDKIEMMLRVRDKSKLNLNFVGFNRIELIARKPEQISLLKDLNFTGHFFGIESLHYPSAKLIGKGIKSAEIRDTIYKMRSAFNDNISITTSLILGLPYESPSQFQENIKWLHETDSGIDSVFFNPLYLTYTTHSESSFFKNPEKYGYSVLPDGSWRSDSWTQSLAIDMAKSNQIALYRNGIQKVPAFRASMIAGYHTSYNYFDLIKTKVKDLHNTRLDVYAKLHIHKYIENLKKLI